MTRAYSAWSCKLQRRRNTAGLAKSWTPYIPPLFQGSMAKCMTGKCVKVRDVFRAVRFITDE